MIPTSSESLGIYEPLFESNLPSLNEVADAQEICLVPSNPVLISFLIDLVSNQTGFFLKDRESFDHQEIAAKQILVVGTGGAGDEDLDFLGADPKIKKVNASDYGSFHGLAAAIMAQA